MRALPLLLALVLAGAGGTAGCTADRSAAAGQRLDVVVGFYPLRFLAERLGGDRVRVTDLARPGVEPHDLEIEPRQLAAIADADLVVHLAGFQPAFDDAAGAEAKGRTFDVAAVAPLADSVDGDGPDRDPHVWLDPVRFATVADRLADRLVAADPDHAERYRTAAGRLRTELAALDAELGTGLANCARREIVTGHAAFGYLADRYRLTQVPISGLSPEAEPTPQRVAEVAALARAKGVTTIFFETLVSPRVARTLAAEVGARAEVLDPVEGLDPDAPAGTDYLSVMRANLDRLRPALGCT